MGLSVKQFAFSALRLLPRTGIASMFRSRFGGIGTIFCLHSVPRTKGGSLGFMRDMDVSADFLERMIRHCRDEEYDIVSLDEIPERLKHTRNSRRFAAFTFDDGYRNNFEVAYPIFQKYRAPFAVYVATDLVEGRRLVWTYLLQELLLARGSIELKIDARAQRWNLATMSEREALFSVIDRHTARLDDQGREEWFRLFFGEHDIDASAASRKWMMSWDMITELANSELGTIGAHTVSHVSLKQLDTERMKWELTESKRILEAKCGRPIRHLSYPFGGFDQVGKREMICAKACGFSTAVTTRIANVFPEHADHTCALPRQVLSGVVEDIGIVQSMTSGFPSALLYGFRRVVTDHGGLKRIL